MYNATGVLLENVTAVMNDMAPELLIAGAAKSGATSLLRYLKSYPNIYISSM